MMLELIAAEYFKLRKRMMVWILALVVVGLIALIYSMLWSESVRVSRFGEHRAFTYLDLRKALFLPGAVPYSLQIVGTFGGILAIILAAGSIGSEYAWGTVRLMATASSGRIRLLTAKLLVVFAFTAAGTLLAIAAALTYSTIIAAYYGDLSASFIDAAFVRDQLAAYGRTLFVLLPYMTLAFAVAVVGRSTLAGVGTGLGFAFIEPIISGLMNASGKPWDSVPNYLLNTNRQVIMLQNRFPEVLPRFGPDGGVNGALSPPMAGLVLAIYTMAFVAIAMVVFRRRDIGSSQ